MYSSTSQQQSWPAPPPMIRTRQGSNHLLSRDGAPASNARRPSMLSRTTTYPAPPSPAAQHAERSPNISPTGQEARTAFPAQTPTADGANSWLSSSWTRHEGGDASGSAVPPVPALPDTVPTHTSTTAGASSSSSKRHKRPSSPADSISDYKSNHPSPTPAAASPPPPATVLPPDMIADIAAAARLGSEASVAPTLTSFAPSVPHESLPPGKVPSIRFSAHQDPRAQRPALIFSPIARILPVASDIIKVGRYSEKDPVPSGGPKIPSSAPVGFKSKVVSRRHCEFWNQSGRWFIKDMKSSSGTFLNHIRLSPPGTESKPFPLNDGDIVQLGIDFKGGEEMIFRCVKIRIELNQSWENAPTSFSIENFKRLREVSKPGSTKASGNTNQDCSICLMPIAPCQALFVSPCSHTWHYKCIRVIINGPHWPQFICPNCRFVADLEAELDEISNDWEDENESEAPVEASPAESKEEEDPHEVLEMIRPKESAADKNEGLDVTLIAANLANLNIGQATSTPDLDSGAYPAPSSQNLARHVPSITTTMDRSGTPSTSKPNSPPLLTRTPSPQFLSQLASPGAMTPSNDVGPFVFENSLMNHAAESRNDGGGRMVAGVEHHDTPVSTRFQGFRLGSIAGGRDHLGRMGSVATVFGDEDGEHSPPPPMPTSIPPRFQNFRMTPEADQSHNQLNNYRLGGAHGPSPLSPMDEVAETPSPSN